MRGAVFANGIAFSLPRHFRESGNPVWSALSTIMISPMAFGLFIFSPHTPGAPPAQGGFCERHSHS